MTSKKGIRINKLKAVIRETKVGVKILGISEPREVNSRTSKLLRVAEAISDETY